MEGRSGRRDARYDVAIELLSNRPLCSDLRNEEVEHQTLEHRVDRIAHVPITSQWLATRQRTPGAFGDALVESSELRHERVVSQLHRLAIGAHQRNLLPASF